MRSQCKRLPVTLAHLGAGIDFVLEVVEAAGHGVLEDTVGGVPPERRSTETRSTTTLGDPSMNLSPDCTLRRNDEIIFTDLDDTVVMMDADKGTYFELDPVGTRIWALLEIERSVAEVCEVLLAAYDVTPEDCRRDVLAFLERAEELGIVEVPAPAAA